MLDNKGFDKWAGGYDASIQRHSKGYPFEGYYNVLSYVHSLIKESKEKKIFDVGVGTGLLTYELYKKGAQIYGIDFSE
jgi:putative AdoMet-dependent methyltransferase